MSCPHDCQPRRYKRKKSCTRCEWRQNPGRTLYQQSPWTLLCAACHATVCRPPARSVIVGRLVAGRMGS